MPRKKSDIPQTDDKQPREKGDFALRVLTVVTAVGLIGIPVYAIQADSWDEFFSIVGIGLMVSGAALVAGSLVGFLFGIPRSPQRSSNVPESALGKQTEEELSEYKTNTNLEEISDWLTKILVGVGLTQVAKVPGLLRQSAEFLAKGLGDFDSSEVLAIAILIFFPVCGFLLVYLWTRVYLPTKLSIVDQYNRKLKQVREEKQQAKEERAQLVEVVADEKRKEEKERVEEQNISKDSARQGLDNLADEYMATRRSMPVGNLRTVAMTTIVAKIMALCRNADYSCEELKQRFEKNTEGDRIVVLGSLQEGPSPDCLHLITEAIANSRSAFEQYQALSAALSVVDLLDDNQRHTLRAAIEHERTDGYIIPENAGRWRLSEQILIR